MGLWRFETNTLHTACLGGQTSNSRVLLQLLFCVQTLVPGSDKFHILLPGKWLSFHVNFKRNSGRLQLKFWEKKPVLNCKLRKKTLLFFFFGNTDPQAVPPQTCVSCPRVTTFEGWVGSGDRGLNQHPREGITIPRRGEAHGSMEGARPPSQAGERTLK